MNNLFDIFSAFLELALLVTAYLIATRKEIKSTIRAYRWQSLVMTITTGLTAYVRLEDIQERYVLSFFIALLPFFLFLMIEPLLARATIDTHRDIEQNSPKTGFFNMIKNNFWATPEQRLLAERNWLKQKSHRSSMSGFAFILLFVLVWAIASRVISHDIPKQLGLLVSLTLHLVGLYATMKSGDIITQVIGLLTMDHGLYLAVVKIVAIPVPANFLVLALYAYTLITILILVFIVPQVSHAISSIDLDEIASTSELKG
jgi:hydrogenase-4 membrane subunit HyfE